METAFAIGMIILVIFVIVTFLYFLSSRLSPVPFFPTNKHDLPFIIETILENNDLESKHHVVIDLGAGTGTVIFPVAAKAYLQGLKTKFIAVEIHPTLVLWMYLRRLFHPNRQNIYIVRGDMFAFRRLLIDTHLKLNLGNSPFITLYLYVSPQALTRLRPELEKLPRGSRIITYMYAIPEWKNHLMGKKLARKNGKNYLFEYERGHLAGGHAQSLPHNF